MNCIYCGKSFDASRGKGDHLIPAALGEFRNAIPFRRVCQTCNNLIGKSEQQLLQCGPESIFRELVIPVTARSRGKKASRVGAHGAPPPQFITNPDVAPSIARHSDQPGNYELLDQLIIRDEKGGDQFVELHPGMSANSLKEKIARLGIKGKSSASLNCDQSLTDEYLTIIKEAYPKSKSEPLGTMPAGVHRTLIEFRSKFTDHYFRALAKIAFHYYLVYSIRSIGDEAWFSEIRNFIINGGEPARFYPQNYIYSKENMPNGIMKPRWMHILAASEENNTAIGYVCLFKRPKSNGIAYQIILGQLPPSRIIIPKKNWAHLYEYDNPVPKSGKVGSVTSITLSYAPLR
jgi:hypothetical protein